MHFRYMWEWHWLMWIFMVVIWILIISGAVAIFRWMMGAKTQSSESAIDILKKRYAKGEISKEEFDKIKEKITEGKQ